MNPIRRARQWLAEQADEYRGEDPERPVGGYLVLTGVYGTGVLATAAVARARGAAVPRLGPWDVAQVAAATHKLSRLLAKDTVTSPLRVPFTRYEGVSAPSELTESVRGHGLRHSAGELVSCPMCLGQWVATGFAAGLVFAPSATRLVLSTFTAIAGADALQHAYAALQQAAGQTD